MIVVVTGTSVPFPRLVQGAAHYAQHHPEEEVWVQYAGAELPPGLEGSAFVPREEMLQRLGAATAVVTHGGSGSLMDALNAGHVPVVVPRRAALGEHVNDHQWEIAQALSHDGRAILVTDVATLGEAVERAKERRCQAPVARPGVELRNALRAETERLLQRPIVRRRDWVWRALRTVTAVVPRRSGVRPSGEAQNKSNNG